MIEQKPGERFEAFLRTVKKLRDPESGCPWDLKQTHLTLRKYMLEEAYEAVEAFSKGEAASICDELGDVLLQVVLNAQLASESDSFAIEDVINNIDEKMKRRHPHVFKNPDNKEINPETVSSQWKEIKLAESGGLPTGIFDDLRLKSFPATTLASKIGERSREINFDWPDAMSVFKHLVSEVDELREELEKKDQHKEAISNELSDIFFTLCQLTRHLELDPETVASQGNLKFLDRFQKVERLASSNSIDVKRVDMETKERLWTNAKTLEKNAAPKTK